MDWDPNNIKPNYRFERQFEAKTLKKCFNKRYFSNQCGNFSFDELWFTGYEVLDVGDC